MLLSYCDVTEEYFVLAPLNLVLSFAQSMQFIDLCNSKRAKKQNDSSSLLFQSNFLRSFLSSKILANLCRQLYLWLGCVYNFEVLFTSFLHMMSVDCTALSDMIFVVLVWDRNGGKNFQLAMPP